MMFPRTFCVVATVLITEPVAFLVRSETFLRTLLRNGVSTELVFMRPLLETKSESNVLFPQAFPITFTRATSSEPLELFPEKSIYPIVSLHAIPVKEPVVGT